MFKMLPRQLPILERKIVTIASRFLVHETIHSVGSRGAPARFRGTCRSHWKGRGQRPPAPARPCGGGAAPSLSDAPGRSSRGPGVAGHLRGCPETRTKQKVGDAPARTWDAKSELWGAGGELNGVSDFGRRGPRRSTPRRGAPARSPASAESRPGGGGGVLRAEGAPVTLSPRRPG